MEDINSFFEKKLSPTLLYDKIYPYTYQPQPTFLMEDLRDLMELIGWLADYYQEYFCYEIFHDDLAGYIRENQSIGHELFLQYENNPEDMPLLYNWEIFFQRKFLWKYGKLYKNRYRMPHEQHTEITQATIRFLNSHPSKTYKNKTRREALKRNINDPRLLAICRNILALMTEEERTVFVNYKTTRAGGAKLNKFIYLIDNSRAWTEESNEVLEDDSEDDDDEE